MFYAVIFIDLVCMFLGFYLMHRTGNMDIVSRILFVVILLGLCACVIIKLLHA